jgi:hypothetical protein
MFEGMMRAAEQAVSLPVNAAGQQVNLTQLAELMNAATGLIVATFDREDDPFHPVQWVNLSANADRRIVIWLEPDQPLDNDWKPWDDAPTRDEEPSA